LRFINFAHGGIFTFGAYFGLVTVRYLSSYLSIDISILIATIFSACLTAILGIVVEKVAYRPIRHAGFLPPFMTSLGMSLLLIYGAMVIWSPTTQSMPPLFAGKKIMLGSVIITWLQMTIFLVTITLTILTNLFIKKTKLGMGIRAASEDKDAASLMGINIDKVISTSFAIGSAIAAVGGVLIGSYYYAVYPLMGWMAGLKGFIAAILGTLGSLYGAVVAGIIIGLAENLGSAYLLSGYKNAIAFVIMIIVLLFKPEGIFSGKFRMGNKV
jgi:branched-chain amino acid transport system permease protein